MFLGNRNFKLKLNLGHIVIPFIDENTSDNLFKDGRIFGLIVENIVSNFFNLEKVYGCEDHDLEDKRQQLNYEVKTLTKQGVKTCPSYMVGKGRKYNIEEHKKYLLNKNGIFIVDNTDFPIITIYYIKDTIKLLFKNMNYKKAVELLNDLTKEI